MKTTKIAAGVRVRFKTRNFDGLGITTGQSNGQWVGVRFENGEWGYCSTELITVMEGNNPTQPQ